MKTKLLLLAIVCVLGSGGLAAATPFDDASAAYERGDYAEALRLFRRLAAAGHQWAQRRLGLIYAEGKAVPQDFAEAVKWYRLAAAQGNVAAQYSLGQAYEKGEGVPQDFEEAVKWYRIAAAREDDWAQMRLGALYAEGKGVPRNYVRAHMWFALAAAESAGSFGDAAAQNRDRIASQMTAGQIAAANELARRCQESKFRECD